MRISLVGRVVVIGLLAYAGLVVAVESTLGFFQPKDGSTFIITTKDDDGVSTDRVLSKNFSKDDSTRRRTTGLVPGTTRH